VLIESLFVFLFFFSMFFFFFFFFFFFSSRRRHTRSYGDWSSDVCSSDLVFSSKQFSFDHRHAAYTGAQRHHDDLGETPGGSGVDFPEQCHARVVLNRERETESLAPPSGEIESWSILILCVCRQHSCRTGIDKPRESRDHTLAV